MKLTEFNKNVSVRRASVGNGVTASIVVNGFNYSACVSADCAKNYQGRKKAAIACLQRTLEDKGLLE